MEQKPTILIAEDDSFNYMYFSALLHNKYNLLRAEDGGQAVEMALNNDVDVVLMDYKMPVMTGLEAMKLIKQQKPDVKIVIQTAFALEEHKQQAILYGADEFLTKPVASNTLLDSLDRLIENQKTHYGNEN